MSGIVEIVLETPCLVCRRLARYVTYQRANETLLARLQQPISHRDVSGIVFDLENLQEQVPVGLCECGADGQETTSVEFADRATREDLNYVADDLSYEMRRLSLDGEVLWESDLERDRRIMDTPDPTPDEALAQFAELGAKIQEIRARNKAWLDQTTDDGEQFAAPYVQAKAQLFTHIGADAYRSTDAFNEPSVRLSADDLAAVCRGMDQLAAGKGLNRDNPLVGVPAESSHALARTLHFEVVAQSASRSEDGLFFLDALHCRRRIDGREVTIYNRVPTRRFVQLIKDACPAEEASGDDLLSGKSKWF